MNLLENQPGTESQSTGTRPVHNPAITGGRMRGAMIGVFGGITSLTLFAVTSSAVDPAWEGGGESPRDEANREGQWRRVIAPGRGRWPEDWTAGHWPMTLVPAIAFGDRLWMVGQGKASSFAWRSGDGVRWDRIRTNADWGERYGMTCVFFDRKL